MITCPPPHRRRSAALRRTVVGLLAAIGGLSAAAPAAEARTVKSTPMTEQEIGCFFYGEGDAVLKLHGGYQPDRAGFEGEFGGIQHLVALGGGERFDERVRSVKVSGGCAFFMGSIAGSPTEAAANAEKNWLEIDRYRRTARYRRPNVRLLRTSSAYRLYFSEVSIRLNKRQTQSAQWVSCRCDPTAIAAHLAAQTQTPAAAETTAAQPAAAPKPAAQEPAAQEPAAQEPDVQETAGCRLFDGPDQQGRSIFIPAHYGVRDLAALGFDDQTTSLRRPAKDPRCRVHLFRDPDYQRRITRIGSLNRLVKGSDDATSSAYCSCR